MAPRKKKQPTRYDAAYDHVGPLGFGFTKTAIRKKIDSLLKVYGNENGWIFIEEGAYELLINCLLEEPEPEPVLLLKGPGDEEEEERPSRKKNNQQPMREDSTIIEKRITRSASAAMKANAIDIYKPTYSEPMTEEVKNRLEKKRSVASFLFGRGDSVPLFPAARKENSQRELTGLDDGKLVSAQEKKLQKKRSRRKFCRLSAFGNGDGKLVSAEEEELQDGNDNRKLVCTQEEELQNGHDGKSVCAQEEELQDGNDYDKLVSSQEEELQDGNDDGKLVSAHEKRSRRNYVHLSAFENCDDKGNDEGKLILALAQEEELQEKFTGPVQDTPQYCMKRTRCSLRPCFGVLDSKGVDEKDYVFSETKTSLRERMIRESPVTPHGVQRTWLNVVGAA